MIVLKVLVFVAILILALVFAYYNLESVRLSFLNYSLEVPLFLTVFASFVLGFLIAFVLAEAKSFGWKRYVERSRKGLLNLWKGYPSRAEAELSKLLDGEEVVPLFLKALEDQGKEPSFKLQKYSEGIVETALATSLIRKDRGKAKELLEKALGKRWENLRARRLLRSLFFLEGEKTKALDLQRSLVSDCERSLREEEKKTLASILVEIGGESSVSEIEKLPPTPTSLAFLSSSRDQRKRKKSFSRSFSEEIQNEVLLILVERNSLTPEIVEIAEENRDKFQPGVLALLYMNVGMYEKLEGLKTKLPEPIRLIVGSGEGDDLKCRRELISLLRMWECSNCGKEYRAYSPVCENCLEWNRLRVKGGS